MEAEIKVPSVENTELKGFPLKALSRSVYPYMLHLLPGISSLLISTLPVYSAFFPKTCLEFFLCRLWLTLVPVLACRIKQVTLLIVTIEAGIPV